MFVYMSMFSTRLKIGMARCCLKNISIGLTQQNGRTDKVIPHNWRAVYVLHLLLYIE